MRAIPATRPDQGDVVGRRRTAAMSVVLVAVLATLGSAGTALVGSSGAGAVTPSGPVITAVSPSSGPVAGGNQVTVSGTGLAAVTSLLFDTTDAADQTVEGQVNTALTAAKSIYESNQQEYPATADLITQLMANEPSMTFSADPVVYGSIPPQVSVATSTDGNSAEFAAASGSGICLLVVDNTTNESGLSNPPGLPGAPAGAGQFYGTTRGRPCTALGATVTDWVVSGWTVGSPASNLNCVANQCTATVPAGTPGTTDVAVLAGAQGFDDAGAYTYLASPVGVPGAPSHLLAQASFEQVNLRWTPPADSGGSPVSEYVVVPFAGATPLTSVHVPAPASGASVTTTVSGLTIGTPYSFEVEAVNAAGTGPPSAKAGPVRPGSGFALAAGDGGVFAEDQMPFFGSQAARPLNAPIVGVAATLDGDGYWLVAADGGLFAYGDAGFYGSMGGVDLTSPIVGMAATDDDGGYWLAAADGEIFAFGDAVNWGSMGSHRLNASIVGIASTPDGGGYWLVAADGGVFAFGDATFDGSLGGQSSTSPIVGIAALPKDGYGYLLSAADGGVFSFGNGMASCPWAGTLPSPVVGIAASPTGQGYWLAEADGKIGDCGAMVTQGALTIGPLNQPVVGIAAY